MAKSYSTPESANLKKVYLKRFLPLLIVLVLILLSLNICTIFSTETARLTVPWLIILLFFVVIAIVENVKPGLSKQIFPNLRKILDIFYNKKKQ